MNLLELGVDIDKIADEMTKEKTSESIGDPSKSLLPPQAQSQKIKNELFKKLETHFLRLANGINSILEQLQQDTTLSKETFESILTKFSEKKPEELTDDELTVLYSGAIELYNTKNYEQAIDAFYTLTELDPNQFLFWKSLGHACFQTNHSKEADEAYAEALKINPADPECYIFQARCLENAHRQGEALDALYKARDVIAKDTQFEAWSDVVEGIIQELKK